MILPDWFYGGVIDQALVLTIDRAYFDLSGGLERWLYRIVRKHGGKQDGRWSFDVAHLYAKIRVALAAAAVRLRAARDRRRQPLPGYHLRLEHTFGRDRLCFTPIPIDPLDAAAKRFGLQLVENP